LFTGFGGLTASSTGAVSISRYAGATSGGPPTSGTFAVGDFVIDRTGTVWICTVAGSPGTWVNAASPVKTYYAQSPNSNVNPANNAVTTVIAGTLVNFTLPVVSDVLIRVVMNGAINGSNVAVNAQFRVAINFDGTWLSALGYFIGINSTATQSTGTLTAEQRVPNVAAGAHTAQAGSYWNGTANGAQYNICSCSVLVTPPSGG
jgi:hypothetical protein